MASPSRTAGRDPGEAVVVKVILQGREVLCHAVVLRLAQSSAETHLVAVAVEVDPNVDAQQRLTAGDVCFIPMNVQVDMLFQNHANAHRVTGLDVLSPIPAPPLVLEQAMAAYQAALDGGFISASGSDAERRVDLPAPCGSGNTAASFVDLGGPQGQGTQEVLDMLRVMNHGQQELMARVSGLEGGPTAGLAAPPMRQQPPAVSFQQATPGVAAMQGAGALLSAAGGWGLGGQSPRPSAASTVPCPMGVGFPDIGVMDESGNSSDNGEPDDAEFNGPALIADAHARRRHRRQERLVTGSLPEPVLPLFTRAQQQMLPGAAAVAGHPLGFQQAPHYGQQQQPHHFGQGHQQQQQQMAFAPFQRTPAPGLMAAPPSAQGLPPGQGFVPGFVGPNVQPRPIMPQQVAGGGLPMFGGQNPGQLDPNTYVQLEVLQQLRALRRGKGSSGSDASSGQSDREDKSSSKLRGIFRIRRRVRHHPLRIITKYRQRCLDRAGISVQPNGTLSAPFAHHHVSLRIRESFGKMVGLWRCHYAVAQILEHLEHRRLEQGAATCCQVLKAIHQTALDHGSWNNSMMLLPWDDALRPDIFGGDPDEMIAAAQWNRGIRDLQSQVGQGLRHHHQQETPAGQGGEEQGNQAREPRVRRDRRPQAKAGAQQPPDGAAAGGQR